MYQDIIYQLAGLSTFNSGEHKRGILVKPNQEIGCQDSLKATITVEPIITNIQLDMQGCVLLKASTNAICLAINNKNKLEGIQIIDNFLNMINNLEFDHNLLDENLKQFEKFKLALSRKNCLTIGAIELKKALEVN